MSGYLPPGCTQQQCDEAQPGYWDEPVDDDCEPESSEEAAALDPPRLLPPTRAQWLDECLVEATERAYELRVRFHNGEVVAQFFNHDFPCYTRRFQVERSS